MRHRVLHHTQRARCVLLLAAAALAAVACQDVRSPIEPSQAAPGAARATADVTAGGGARVYILKGLHHQTWHFVVTGGTSDLTVTMDNGNKFALTGSKGTDFESMLSKADQARQKGDDIIAKYAKVWAKMGLPDVDDGLPAPGRRRKSSASTAPSLASALAMVGVPPRLGSPVHADECIDPSDPTCDPGGGDSGSGGGDPCSTAYLALYNDTQALHADQFALGTEINQFNLMNCSGLGVMYNAASCGAVALDILASQAMIQFDQEYLDSDVQQLHEYGC